jgi:glycoprotein-N-acetylgalactosamine 3-beta-galactosyltransferase
MSNQVRILCWVLTMPDAHESKARHVQATWGKHCDILYFVSTKEDEKLPVLVLNAQESRKVLWKKSRSQFHQHFTRAVSIQKCFSLVTFWQKKAP